jgi:thiamine pyrophosphokinase
MRALLVGGAPACEAESLLRLLSADSDIVVAVDSGAALCLAAGVPPQALVGDLDSIDPGHLAILEAQGVSVERFPAEKDVTDLDLALDYVRRLGATGITLTSVIGGRIDHTLGVLGSLARHADLKPVVEEVDQSILFMSTGGQSTCHVEPAGATVSCVALLDDAIVSVAGVRWPLARARISALDTLGISNVVIDGSARFEIHEGCVAILAPQVDGVRAAIR